MAEASTDRFIEKVLWIFELLEVASNIAERGNHLANCIIIGVVGFPYHLNAALFALRKNCLKSIGKTHPKNKKSTKTETSSWWISIPSMLWTIKTFVWPSTKPTLHGCTLYNPLSCSEVVNLTSMASRWDSSPFSQKDMKCIPYWWLLGKRPTAPYFELSLKSNAQGSRKKFFRDFEGTLVTVASEVTCLAMQCMENNLSIPLICGLGVKKRRKWKETSSP